MPRWRRSHTSKTWKKLKNRYQNARFMIIQCVINKGNNVIFHYVFLNSGILPCRNRASSRFSRRCWATPRRWPPPRTGPSRGLRTRPDSPPPRQPVVPRWRKRPTASWRIAPGERREAREPTGMGGGGNNDQNRWKTGRFRFGSSSPTHTE